uniref:Peptidase S1 domain-containing protein n=1 Tax=Molossus molossus TaxID=27622 RepID=A0A7J8IAG8_MOLMO|nr:hypothetical protein HJG59_014917 [Molossus molossus]
MAKDRMEDGRAVFLLPVALLLPWAHGSLALTQAKTSFPNNTNVSNISCGEPTNVTEFPWHVDIFHQGRRLCGGSILSEWWVLSASRCFINKTKSALEIIHDDSNSTTKKLIKKKVDKLIIHHDFISWILSHDVALLLLKTPFNFSVATIPICLSEVIDIQRWKNCWVSRMDVTVPVQGLQKELRKVNVTLLEWNMCTQVLPVSAINMVCATNSEETNNCQGDHGGPLVCQKNDKKTWYQVGVASWGEGCGQMDLPGVYTMISEYLTWMESETFLSGRPYPYTPDSGYSLPLSPWALLLLYSVILLLIL